MDNRTYRRLFEKGIGKIQKNINKQKYKCLYPGCNNLSIQSHSQQKEKQLRSIAREGQVYCILRNHYKNLKNKKRVKPSMALHGISEASTFSGFCSHHDKTLFSSIDTNHPEKNNEHQALLYLLRNFSYEFAQKRKSFEWHQKVAKLLTDLNNYDALQNSNAIQKGLKKFLETDAPHYFSKIWDALDSDNRENIINEWVVINKNIGLSTSCMFSPLLEMYERFMHYSYNAPQPLLSFSIIPTQTESHIVISWLEEHSELANWVSLMTADDKHIEELVNLGAFKESEDTCVNPDIWEALSKETQEMAIHAMEPDVSRGPIEHIPIIIELQ